MMSLYRFSPIRDEQQFFTAVGYIATQGQALCKKITGVEYLITNLTVFSHYPDECGFLKEMLLELGEYVRDKNGPVVRLKHPLVIGMSTISIVRVRIPDPYRAQVGCCYFAIPNFQEFKEKYLASHPQNLTSIPRPEYEMLEFFDPDVDVLAYVLSAPLYQ